MAAQRQQTKISDIESALNKQTRGRTEEKKEAEDAKLKTKEHFVERVKSKGILGLCDGAFGQAKSNARGGTETTMDDWQSQETNQPKL
jgi:hypothetical protein